MNCVILQPSYIPWRGYFHQIQKADIFVFYDDVAYDKHGWRNRNRIKSPNGPIWLTIPVLSKGNVINKTPINQISIDWGRDWINKHWSSLKQTYSKAPYFGQYVPLLEGFYSQRPEKLADFTIDLTVALAAELGLNKTKFVRSSDLKIRSEGNSTVRIIEILQKLGASNYISGPAAKEYLDTTLFEQARISLEYMNYNYPEYPQLYPPYDAQLSILDLLFMTGSKSGDYIWKRSI